MMVKFQSFRHIDILDSNLMNAMLLALQIKCYPTR